MCIYDALTIVVILSVKELKKKKKKGLEVCFLCLNCEDDQESVHLFPIVRFFFGMAPDLFCFSEKWRDHTQKLCQINKLYIRKKEFHEQVCFV